MKLTKTERMELRRQASARTGRAKAARCARLILLLADELTWAEIRATLGGYLASKDPDFEAKGADIIGLNLNPPLHAAVSCVDEETAILTNIVVNQPCGKEIPVIADKLSAHKTQRVAEFLAQHPTVQEKAHALSACTQGYSMFAALYFLFCFFPPAHDERGFHDHNQRRH